MKSTEFFFEAFFNAEWRVFLLSRYSHSGHTLCFESKVTKFGKASTLIKIYFKLGNHQLVMLWFSFYEFRLDDSAGLLWKVKVGGTCHVMYQGSSSEPRSIKETKEKSSSEN